MNPKKVINGFINRNNYNIGFAVITPDEFVIKKALPAIKWVKHSYKDRFFADPFILEVTNDTIFCLVEECIFGSKGTIALLEIDKNTFVLRERKTILKLETHLSYPAVMYHNGETYVYPENGHSGSLTMYHWNKKTRSLDRHVILANDDLIDSSIAHVDGKYYLLATTLRNGTLTEGYLYKSEAFDGPYEQLYVEPVTRGLATARPGGGFFQVGSEWYRPAQDCRGGYGKALNIMKIGSFEPFKEDIVFRLTPQSARYNQGLHTLNFHSSGLAVIDSKGFRHRILGPILCPIYDLVCKLRRTRK